MPEPCKAAVRGGNSLGFRRISPPKKNQHLRQKSRNDLSAGTPRLGFAGFPPLSKFPLSSQEAKTHPCTSPGRQGPRSPRANSSALSPCTGRKGSTARCPATRDKPDAAASWAFFPPKSGPAASRSRLRRRGRIARPCSAKNHFRTGKNGFLTSLLGLGGFVVVCFCFFSFFFLVFPEAAYFVRNRAERLTSELISCLYSV